MTFPFLKSLTVSDAAIGELHLSESLNFCFDLFSSFLFELDLYPGKIHLIICIAPFCREITSGTVGHNGSVAANSSTAIAVGSKVPYSFLVNLMRDIGADWDIDYDFDVGVKLKLPIIHSFTIPLHKKGTFKLPTLSDIF